MKTLNTCIFRIGILALLMANLLSFEFAFASGPTCSLVFSEQNSIDRTIHDLSAMRISLDQAKANGTNSIELTALTSDYRKKEKAFVEYVETSKIMNRKEFSEKMRQEINRIQSEKQTDKRQDDRNREEEARRRKIHEEQIKDTMINGTRAIMHRVEPGSFKMGRPGKQVVDVTLTKPFDMQATQMTQIVWRTVVDLVAQKFPGKYQIDADPSKFKGDTRPVERVSFDDVQTWIKALNELSALDEPALADLIPDHKKGDIYRLPTEAEWEFVVRGRGQYRDTYHFGNDVTRLGEYAWYSDNSGNQTHPVAQKIPLLIGDKEFYDMHGNVDEWTQDWRESQLRGGVDPRGPLTGGERILRGGGWSSSSLGTSSWYRFYIEPQTRYHALGFRLVRTVP